MADIVVTALQAIQAAKTLCDTLQDDQVEAKRLLDRVAALESCVQDLQRGAQLKLKSTGGVVALRNLVAVVADGQVAIARYSETSWWRGAEKWVNAQGYMDAFGSLNARLSAVVGDLTLVGSIAHLVEKPPLGLWRQEDLQDAQASIEGMVSRLLEEASHDNEATRKEMVAMQAEIADNYKSLVKTMLQSACHSNLTLCERRALSQGQERLTSLCAERFSEIIDGIAHLDSKLDELVGGGIDTIKAIVRSAEQHEMRAAQLRMLTVSASEVQLGTKINAGGFGGISGLFSAEYKRRQVAVKRIVRIDGTELSANQIANAENEVLMMHYVAGPEVVNVYGLVVEPSRVLIVMELAPFGSLWDLLANRAAYEELPISLCVAWMADLCNGTAFLHSKRVEHKDLKAQNLLIYASPNRLRAKICDFGSAMQSSTEASSGIRSSASSTAAGTLEFMAPECRAGEKSSAKSDVFSIGMTTLQILTRANPGIGHWDEQITAALTLVSASLHAAGFLQADESRVLAVLGTCLTEAIALDPKMRPSAKGLTAQLDALLLGLFGEGAD